MGKLWISAVLILLMISFATPVDASSIDNGLPDGYEPDVYNAIPAQQFKDVFETETIEVSGISVVPDHGNNVFTETIHFRIFNSTTQETEYEIDTINDGTGHHTLPAMKLKKNHNYIFFVEDPWFQLGTKKYVQILDGGAKMANDGPGAYDYKYIVKDGKGNDQYNKEYKKLTSINVYKRSEKCENPRDDARCCIGCTNVPVIVTYKGERIREKLNFRFVSDIETRNGMTNYKDEVAERGILYANLLEDVTYMVYLDSDKYVMDPFPIVVKDKSEYGEGRYAYNHTTCVRVDAEHPVKLYDSAEEAHGDRSLGDPNPSVVSLKGRTAVDGMSFRHLLILDRIMDKSAVPEVNGKNCDVIGITAVNPHRWEISKLMGTDFNITWKEVDGKLVTHVCYVKDGALKEIGFTQKSGKEVSFSMDSLSLYPVVIEYDPDKTYVQKQEEDRAAEEDSKKKEEAAATEDRTKEETAKAEAKTKMVKTVTVNVPTVSAKAIDKAVKAQGGSNKYVTKIILGKKVRKIRASSFKKYKKVTYIEARTKKLTKKNAKNSLKDSKIKTIKVKVGKKKVNKQYVKKYKKIFTKKISGRKVVVK